MTVPQESLTLTLVHIRPPGIHQNYHLSVASAPGKHILLVVTLNSLVSPDFKWLDYLVLNCFYYQFSNESQKSF